MSTSLRSSFLRALAATALLDAITAAPTNDGTFSLQAVRRAGSQTGSSAMDSNWWIPIQLGTPPEEFIFLPDSGSPYFEIQSTFLQGAERPPPPLYDPSKSSTAKKLDGYNYTVAFASGYRSGGVVYSDVADVGGIKLTQDLQVQTYNNAGKKAARGTESRRGTLGLNFDHGGLTTEPKRLPNWLINVTPHLKQGLFTIDFRAASNTGTLTWGTIDASRYSGKIGYSPVDKQGGGEWVPTITGIKTSKGVVANTSWKPVIDSGTSDASVPKNIADAYFSQVSGAKFVNGQYAFPCSTKLPDFEFVVGGVTVSIPGGNLKQGSGSSCGSKIQVGSGQSQILGQSFIEEVFVVFDWDNGRVGFANKGKE